MTKYLIIAICVVLCFCILFNYTRADAVNKIGDIIGSVADLSNNVIDLGGYVDNEKSFNRKLVDGIFGIYVYSEGQAIDIAKHIRTKYLPVWIANEETLLDVNIEISPHLWSFTREIYYFLKPNGSDTKTIDNVTNAMRIYVDVTYESEIPDGKKILREARIDLVVWGNGNDLNILAKSGSATGYVYAKSYKDELPSGLSKPQNWVNADLTIVEEKAPYFTNTINGRYEYLATYQWLLSSFNVVGNISPDTFPFIY